ncbi:molybdenum cofactor guanylyltransferase [Virgibacillus profundi]|uniref:Probable molybdenum cofactor guanylyltransferase n=1 Tax=Virgibacillus profundi TaxID=2024555 RepID=A0A2A2IE83_9BACI|nr:molybdenum cofactor guanylyltransferase [Virgibacillus profundi]PAV29450.1 molybdenum cofactor guanylyltransferase [Virgibacillus profundi]PXY53619.1 molybdenum cofactor guanylyltransferase [Virgibacillus profundi]
MHICGVILSGGKSSRMGTNKSLLKLGNQTVIEHIANELQTYTDEVIVIANEPSVYKFLNLEIYSDRYIDKGPLAGFETAMYHKNADAFIIAACDMPLISGKVYEYLLNQLEYYDAVVPVFDDQLHPLSGIYKKNVLPKIQGNLNKDVRKVKSFFDDVHVNFIHDFGQISDELLQRHFFNMNKPSHYEEAKSLWLV